MVFNFKCIDVFTSADGRREYRLSVIVEQTAPVMFRVGKRYDFLEAGPEAGAKSQLDPSSSVLSPKEGDLVVITLPDDMSDSAVDDLRARLSLGAQEGKYHIIVGALSADVLTDEQLDTLGLQRKKAKAKV